MKIHGPDVRDGNEFVLTAKPANLASATFVTIIDGDLYVTRRLAEFLAEALPDEHPILAHWHGQHRTDGFRTTIGQLRALAKGVEA